MDLVVAHQQITTARPLFEFRKLHPELGIVGEEIVAGLPFTVNQCVPDEKFAGQFWVHRRVGDPAARNQGKAVQGDPLIRHDRTTRNVPMRLAIAALHQVPGDAFDGLRLDTRSGTPVKSAGLHQVGNHDPARWALGQHRAGRQYELRISRPGVFA